MPRTPPISTVALFTLCLASACDAPATYVVFDNHEPSVVYRAFWQAVSLPNPVAPAASSDKLPTVAASANTAYVLLAPGWDAASSAPPTTFIVLESRGGFAVHLNHTLCIPIDDTTFAGDCAAGSFLAQAEADFITTRVFASDFANLRYDAAICSTTESR
jgi:hypothetical protein